LHATKPHDKIKTIKQTTTEATNLSKKRRKGAHLAVEEEDPMVEAIKIVGDLRPPPFLLPCGGEKHRNGSTLKANLDAIILKSLPLSLSLSLSLSLNPQPLISVSLLFSSRLYFCSQRGGVRRRESWGKQNLIGSTFCLDPSALLKIILVPSHCFHFNTLPPSQYFTFYKISSKSPQKSSVLKREEPATVSKNLCATKNQRIWILNPRSDVCWPAWTQSLEHSSC